MEAQERAKRRLRRWAVWSLVLLVAAAVRFWNLPALPPGIEHDEVAEVLIAEKILSGQHAVFFADAYGQEPLFLYLVAVVLPLLGRNVLALRFVSAAVGLLTVAAGARAARRLFGERVALVTAMGLAVMLWPVFWSRVGLRGMTLPLVLCLGFDALWRALQSPSQNRHALLAGFWCGLSAYTYLAARALPILLGIFGLYLALSQFDFLRRTWRVWALAIAVALALASPLALYLWRTPQVQTRVYEVDAPLRALRQGDPRAILANVPRLLGMFTLQGDSVERNNVPPLPVFPEPLWASLFWLGLICALWRWREARYGFVLLWLGVMLTPSLATTDAPNFVRTLGALPAAMMAPGIGLDRLVRWIAQRKNARFWTRTTCIVLGGAFLLNLGLMLQNYAGRWPEIPSVQFIWQTDFRAIAGWLDAHPAIRDVTISGPANTSMDPASMDLLLKRADVRVRWVDSGSPLSNGGALVAPQAGGWLLVPDIVPVDAVLEDQLAAWSAVEVPAQRFRAFELPQELPVAGELAAFEGNLSLSQVQLPSAPVAPGQNVMLVSVWHVQAGAHPPFKIFVHLVDAQGAIVAQHDGLDSPAQFWQPGDRIVQLHPLKLPDGLLPGDYAVRIGLYDRETLAPYPLTDGRGFFEAGVISLQP